MTHCLAQNFPKTGIRRPRRVVRWRRKDERRRRKRLTYNHSGLTLVQKRSFKWQKLRESARLNGIRVKVNNLQTNRQVHGPFDWLNCTWYRTAALFVKVMKGIHYESGLLTIAGSDIRYINDVSLAINILT